MFGLRGGFLVADHRGDEIGPGFDFGVGATNLVRVGIDEEIADALLRLDVAPGMRPIEGVDLGLGRRRQMVPDGTVVHVPHHDELAQAVHLRHDVRELVDAIAPRALELERLQPHVANPAVDHRRADPLLRTICSHPAIVLVREISKSERPAIENEEGDRQLPIRERDHRLRFRARIGPVRGIGGKSPVSDVARVQIDAEATIAQDLVVVVVGVGLALVRHQLFADLVEIGPSGPGVGVTSRDGAEEVPAVQRLDGLAHLEQGRVEDRVLRRRGQVALALPAIIGALGRREFTAVGGDARHDRVGCDHRVEARTRAQRRQDGLGLVARRQQDVLGKDLTPGPFRAAPHLLIRDRQLVLDREFKRPATHEVFLQFGDRRLHVGGIGIAQLRRLQRHDVFVDEQVEEAALSSQIERVRHEDAIHEAEPVLVVGPRHDARPHRGDDWITLYLDLGPAGASQNRRGQEGMDRSNPHAARTSVSCPHLPGSRNVQWRVAEAGGVSESPMDTLPPRNRPQPDAHVVSPEIQRREKGRAPSRGRGPVSIAAVLA